MSPWPHHPLLALADLVVSPRLGGHNLPLKIFDYMAAGRPIVATDHPTHRKVLDEERAILVPPTSGAFAEAIIHLLRNTETAKRLGAAARAYAEGRFGSTAFQRAVAEIYERVARETERDSSAGALL